MKKIFIRVGLFFVILSTVLFITDSTFLYKAILYNFVDIDDLSLFEYRKVEKGDSHPWALGNDYNKVPLPEKLAAELEKLRSVAFLVIVNDSIRFEKYWEQYNDSSFSNSFSMAKTFVGMLTGIAVDEGKIKSIDQSVGDFLPEFKEGRKSKITIRHLLTMSSGLKWDESYTNPFSVTTKAYYGTDLKKLMLNLEVEREPGKTFIYQSCNTQLLAFVLEAATGKKLSDYASEKLWKPLGAAQPALWSLDHEGGDEKAYCCFYTNARDFARFGKLYLDNGNWNGKQIISENYVKESVTPAPLLNEEGSPNNCYGFSWWLLPEYKGHHIFYARGILGQYVIVIPDKKIIIVRLGHKRGEHLPDNHVQDVFTYIDGVLEMVQ